MFVSRVAKYVRKYLAGIMSSCQKERMSEEGGVFDEKQQRAITR